jgi:hypothetical protein
MVVVRVVTFDGAVVAGISDVVKDVSSVATGAVAVSVIDTVVFTVAVVLSRVTTANDENPGVVAVK